MFEAFTSASFYFSTWDKNLVVALLRLSRGGSDKADGGSKARNPGLLGGTIGGCVRTPAALEGDLGGVSEAQVLLRKGKSGLFAALLLHADHLVPHNLAPVRAVLVGLHNGQVAAFVVQDEGPSERGEGGGVGRRGVLERL